MVEKRISAAENVEHEDVEMLKQLVCNSNKKIEFEKVD